MATPVYNYSPKLALADCGAHYRDRKYIWERPKQKSENRGRDLRFTDKINFESLAPKSQRNKAQKVFVGDGKGNDK